ncbi:hypothetical protein M413DRAFT_23487 [Hebeloma cylindrosporum]|uniref:HNH nuclease domain-containing protein n=1 Tax=Hebeloma cylindrosporum TaxID=76867 RepID=A0A0C2YBP7_HEBCY|nr:hypothetical protein M413DRAFT_23487 [Hebeloma cylindrosporum h7]
MSTPSNAMLMRTVVIAAFHDNAFGIDDDYRLAYFRPPPPEVHFAGPGDYFLREHFKHCLRVHLLHGDTTEDYPQPVILKALAHLGLSEPDGGTSVPAIRNHSH